MSTMTATTARVLRVEIADDVRAIVREPAALFFSVLMPVGFFALFVSLFGHQTSGSGTSAGTLMVATFGTFGVLAVTLLNPAISVAGDRERGWLRAKQVSGVPTLVTLAAKMLAALPYALAVLVAMAVAAALNGSLDAPIGKLLIIAVVLLLGSLPFTLLGLAVGFVASPNATSAILNAFMFPAAVLSGLWMPLEIMPAFVQHLAPFLPTYHLAQLAVAQLNGGPVLVHILVLLGMTVVTAALASVAYRRGRS
ncbi:ABC transporter permease [Amycolatopsis sp.]|jgi:ABC-2 type transport system permease protein|uniref:ABC transporter permease n=1 Tax=Amycolatopsis sp. TaxID=37632 RepID=UPI002DFC1130|nr:ABC transporter permease [Amycolatopsis sp.]